MRNRLPGSGSLTRRGEKSWRVQWAVKGKLYWETITATSAKEAEGKQRDLMTRVRAAILDGTYIEKFGRGDEEPSIVAPGKIKISKAWGFYLRSQSRPDTGHQTLIQYEYQYTRFKEWMETNHPGVAYLADVTPKIAEEFASHIAVGHTPSTFNKYRNLLHLVFRILLGGSARNPWQDIQRKKKKPQSKRSLTTDELAVIFSKAVGEMKTLFLMGYHTALRLGDVCMLLWSEIDWDAREIHHKIRKTGKNAVIAINPELYQHMEEVFRDRAKTAKHICPQFAADYIDARGNRKDVAVRKIQAFLGECGIRVHREGTGPDNGCRAVVDVGFHSLRHTWVSLSRQSGTDSATVESVVGWGNPEMARIYTHVDGGHIAEAIARIPPVLTAGKVPPATVAVQPQTLSDADLKTTADALLAEIARRHKAV